MQGFYFVLLQYRPIQAFTGRFPVSMQVYRPRHKTAHRALQALFLLFALFCRRCVAGTSAYTAPPAPRWSTHTRRNTSSTYQIPTPRRTLCRSAQPPYYNKVYKSAPLLWIHARQCSTSQTMQTRLGQLLPSADRWQVLHPAHLLRGQRLHLCKVSPAACNLAPVSGQGAPGGQSSGSGRAGGAELLTATAVSLFGLSPDS